MGILPRKGSINFVFVFSGPSVEESCLHGTSNAGLKLARLCSSHIDIISLLCTCPFANYRLLLLREFSHSLFLCSSRLHYLFDSRKMVCTFYLF